MAALIDFYINAIIINILFSTDFDQICNEIVCVDMLVSLVDGRTYQGNPKYFFLISTKGACPVNDRAYVKASNVACMVTLSNTRTTIQHKSK